MVSLKPEVEDEYKEAFSLFDKDSDGKLTRAEFIKIIEALGLENSKKIAEEMLKEVGAGDYITFELFRQAFINRMKVPYKRKEIQDAFEIFDTEKTGKILDLELRQILTQMNTILEQPEIERLIKECEPDSKNMLDYSKFIEKMYTECIEP